MSEVIEPQPPSRRRVALTVLFHSTCAILSTILSKSALNGIDAPVTLLAFQTTVQVILLTTIGYFTKWITLSRPVSVCCNEVVVEVVIGPWFYAITAEIAILIVSIP
jgi:GDP-fucose transporter C1